MQETLHVLFFIALLFVRDRVLVVYDRDVNWNAGSNREQCKFHTKELKT